MFDDDICSATDMKELEAVCKNNGLVRCDRCDHSDPNAGYDVPYCMKLTKLGKGKGTTVSNSTEGRAPYKLEKNNIPKKCRYWLSAKKMDEKRESSHKIRKAQNAMDRLSLSEKSKIKM